MSRNGKDRIAIASWTLIMGDASRHAASRDNIDPRDAELVTQRR